MDLNIISPKKQIKVRPTFAQSFTATIELIIGNIIILDKPILKGDPFSHYPLEYILDLAERGIIEPISN